MKFDEAVALAKDALAMIPTLPGPEDDLAVFVLHFVKTNNQQSLNSIILASETQALSYGALIIAVTSLIRDDRKLPENLKQWFLQHLSGERKRPPVSARFKRGFPGHAAHRNLVIHATVAMLRGHGLPITRPAYAMMEPSDLRTACDAVGIAMGELNLSPCDYDTIRKIFFDVERKYKNGQDPWISLRIVAEISKKN